MLKNPYIIRTKRYGLSLVYYKENGYYPVFSNYNSKLVREVCKKLNDAYWRAKTK